MANIKKFEWSGKIVSLNRRTAVRVIKGKIPIVYNTTIYKKFIESLTLKAKLLGKLEGYVNLAVFVTMWKMADSDNILKPILDSLEKAEVIENDRYIKDIYVYRDYNKRDETDHLTCYLIPAESRALHPDLPIDDFKLLKEKFD